MSVKIYTFDEALEYIDKYEEADEAGYHDIPEQTQFPDVSMGEFENEMDNDLDDAMENAMDYLSNMMNNFVNRMMMEIESIIENESDRLDRVSLQTKVLDSQQTLTRIQLTGYYENFTHNTAVLIPTTDWENDKKEVKLWMKAFVLREYKIKNGEIK